MEPTEQTPADSIRSAMEAALDRGEAAEYSRLKTDLEVAEYQAAKQAREAEEAAKAAALEAAQKKVGRLRTRVSRDSLDRRAADHIKRAAEAFEQLASALDAAAQVADEFVADVKEATAICEEFGFENPCSPPADPYIYVKARCFESREEHLARHGSVDPDTALRHYGNPIPFAANSARMIPQIYR